MTSDWNSRFAFAPCFRCAVVLAALLVSTPGMLWADTVLLRDGRLFENVQAIVARQQVVITDENGRVFRFPLRDLRSVVPGPYHPKQASRAAGPVEPAGRSGAKQSAADSHDQETPEAESSPPGDHSAEDSGASAWRSPEALFAQSLIPGWSGFYLGDRWWAGVIFSILEVSGAVYLHPWTEAPSGPLDENFPTAVLLLAAFSGGAISPSSFGPALILEEQVRAPRSRALIPISEYNRQKRDLFAGFGALLILDAVLAAFFANSSAPEQTVEKSRLHVPRVSFELGERSSIAVHFAF